MSIKYRLQKNYGKLKEKAEFRAIIMERQTIGLERIGQNIQGAMSLTRADVFATVMALGDEIAYHWTEMLSICRVSVISHWL